MIEVQAGIAAVPDADGMALFGTWRVGSPHRQEAAAQVTAAAWQARPWPGAGLRSYAVLAGDDGDTLLHVAQVTDPGGARGQDLSWKQEVDEAVPGIERSGITAARLQRSTPAYGPTEQAGCVVLVTRDFDDPDVERAHALVEAVFEGSAHTPPARGLIRASFYVSLDGSQVFNYALWTSADAHEEAIGNRPPQLEDNPRWRQAHAWLGLTSTTFQRFRPLLRLTAA
ncbi:hypothetical protein [Nonomuraea sp. NPDC049400]|uniref:hypothetical protein n=1 Tax=Nonomuraea sp. NPDC049400 TaxID=3364352 RepID=UPI0037951110